MKLCHGLPTSEDWTMRQRAGFRRLKALGTQNWNLYNDNVRTLDAFERIERYIEERARDYGIPKPNRTTARKGTNRF